MLIHYMLHILFVILNINYMLFITSRIYWILTNRVTKLYVNLNVESICSVVFHSSFFLLYLNLIYYKKRFKMFHSWSNKV